MANPKYMNKASFNKLIFLVTAIVVMIYACQKETEECKECKEVTYENGVKVDEDTAETYCGQNLEEKEDDTVKVGNRTRTYECS